MNRPEWSLSEIEAEELFRLLEIDADSARETAFHIELNEIAAVFLRQHAQQAAMPSLKEQKQRLREIAATADRFSAALDDFLTHDCDAEFALLLAYRRTTHPMGNEPTAPSDLSARLRTDRRHLERLREALAAAAVEFSAPTGTRPRLTLSFLVLSLCRLYEAHTGTPATHNPNEKTRYTGEPHSHAGRFIAAAVKAILGNVTPGQISTAMRRAIRTLEAERKCQRGAASAAQ